MTICQSMGKGIMGRLLLYGTMRRMGRMGRMVMGQGDEGTILWGTMGLWDDTTHCPRSQRTTHFPPATLFGHPLHTTVSTDRLPHALHTTGWLLLYGTMGRMGCIGRRLWDYGTTIVGETMGLWDSTLCPMKLHPALRTTHPASRATRHAFSPLPPFWTPSIIHPNHFPRSLM